MTDHLNMARLVRPFPTRRLADGLYHVEATSASLHKLLFTVLTEQPGTPEAWCQRLQEIRGLLMTLREEAARAEELVDELYEGADREFEASVRAVQSMLIGFNSQEIPVSPEEDAAWEAA